jgi:hypothetical protein
MVEYQVWELLSSLCQAMSLTCGPGHLHHSRHWLVMIILIFCTECVDFRMCSTCDVVGVSFEQLGDSSLLP